MPTPTRASVGFERLDVALAAVRRGVASIGEHVDEHARHAALLRQLDDRVQVRLMAVDAAVREQADQVQRVRVALAAIDGFEQLRPREEITVANALVDARQVLIDDASGAEVGVADFGVAHLAFGQADGLARRWSVELR